MQSIPFSRGLNSVLGDLISPMHQAVASSRTAFLMVGREGDPLPAGGQEKSIGLFAFRQSCERRAWTCTVL
jgi:hypothetical protein